MQTKNLSKIIIFSLIILCLTFGFGTFFNLKDEKRFYAETEKVEYGEYLSNLTPITQSIGYDKLKTDKNMSGAKISFIVNGERTYFEKGIMAHATSTLVYDLGESHPYEYFSTYLGIDAVQNGKGDAKFSVFSSLDNETWKTELEPTNKNSGEEATFLKFSVSGVRYIKFVFDSKGNNNYDHTGLGDCKVFTVGYDFENSEDFFKTVEYYNNLFAGKTSQEILQNYNLELMQRKFIESVGYDNLKYSFLKGTNEADRRTMLNWLYNDQKALKDFVTGGKPNGGNYIKAIDILSKLYKAYANDLSDTTALFEPEAGSTRNRGDVYRTMMISIALTNAKSVYGWVNSGDILDPLARYEAFKKTYLAEDYHLRYYIFENLCVEEMRYLMSSRINSEEIYWLNAYATIKYGSATYPAVYSPHRHIKYGRDWNYKAKGYYEEENFQQYNEKYMLEQYGVHLTSTPRLWMAMDGSQICWGISYLGTNFASAFGVPSHYVRQPDHAAFLVYNKDSNGRTIWTIDNDIFGWTKTWMNEDTVGNGNNRMMCDWGTTGSEQVKLQNGTYILLAATALDDQENYENAELILSLKSLTEKSEQEELFRQALSIMPYHLDAWYELIKLYISTGRSDEDLMRLAEEIATNMYCFPLPMHELIGLIKTELTTRNTDSSLIQLANVENIDNIALQKATQVKTDDNAKNLIAQLDPCIQEAKYILGIVEDEKLASFSFDGENKNKLVFNSKYSSVRYKYSIDGGVTWSEGLATTSENLTHELTLSELNSITSANDILIWLEGWGTENVEKAFRIDISDGVAVSGIEENDNENKFLGTFNKQEYSLDNIVWQDLTEESLFEGEKTVYVRNKRTGTTLQGEATTFVFTDNTNSVRNYISISNLELFAYSTEEASRNDYAKHAIDGKLSTRWHTKWKGGDTDRFIAIKLNKSRYISGLDYTPVGGNGTMLSCSVYVSQDGTNWTLATSVSGLGNNSTKKSLTFTPVYGQYVKVVGTNTVGGFCSARLIEFFEDTTMAEKQIKSLEIEVLPKQSVYIINQKINYNGLRAKVVFQDDSAAIIPNELLTLEDITFTQIGVQNIIIKYGETIQTNFEVHVIDISDSVALVGENYYSSLKDAIENISQEGTIELLKDVEVTSTFAISSKIIINGNNHILTRQSDFTSAIFSVSGTGKLEINNLTIDGGAVWTGEANSVLGRGTTNSGIIATAPLISAAENSTLILNNCELKNNYNNYSTNAQGTGGAIFMGTSAIATITNTNITNCHSFLFGSAIYTRDYSSLTINSGTFSGNSGNSSKNTTLFCVDNSSVCVINGGTFENNLAYSKGGAFWVSNGRLDINGGKFKNNYSTCGAGIYLYGNAKVNIADFEEMEEVYLPSGKKIYVLGLLLDKTLNVKMANTANDTVVAICEEEELIYKVLKSIVVTDKLLYVDGTNIKISDKTNAKAMIVSGGREIYFSNLLQAINCADDGDEIVLKDNATLSEEIVVEKTITINFSDYLLEGIENIKTQSLCSTYSENKVEIKSHTFNQNITYVWSGDNATCTATGHCECGETYVETVTATRSETSGTHTGEVVVTMVATFTYTHFEQQSKVVSTPMSHTFNQSITYVWSENNTTCTATGHCECGETYVETVNATKIVTTQASYDSEEISKFVAEFTFATFETQEKTNVITGERLTQPTEDDDNPEEDPNEDQKENPSEDGEETSGESTEEKTTEDLQNETQESENQKMIIIISVAGGGGLGSIIGIIIFIALKRKRKKINRILNS